ncbi:ExeA family protein [Bilifractor sp. LCP19S3_H10]|uniref:ExeA family protein n=1 Tax=Bilifractor sp. LCP19S3_H10 TaxID=3438736 RepID=UPI003F93A566
MMSRLEYFRTVRGIGVFTARPGMGKTFALRCFAKELNLNQSRMEYICLSTVSIGEFYSQLCGILGVSHKGGKPGRFRSIQDQIYYLYKEKRQPLLLAVNEAQYLNTATLNDIKMLMNYGYDSLNCFALILCGESHLNSILRKPVHEARRQRITVHYDFEGLSDKEVPDYIYHKLKTAGGAPTMINAAAMSSINSLSQGNLRMVSSSDGNTP